jgi:DNA-binding SARP family transcriptional activator
MRRAPGDRSRNCPLPSRRLACPTADGTPGGAAPVARVQLQLLRRFELRCDGAAIALPESAQRLLAFLAVHGRPQHRASVAATLWMDTTEEKAGANLRTALWRARRVDAPVVACSGAYLCIEPGVEVDAAEVILQARALLADPLADAAHDPSIDTLSADLLPEWYEDWVLLERERLRQIRLHGLEALCVRLAHLGHHLDAIEAGMLATSVEPLRESAHRALILAHLAEGNMAEAVRQYDAFATVLDDTLGIAPTESLRALVAPCR